MDDTNDPTVMARELATKYVALVNGLVARGWASTDVAFVAQINADAQYAAGVLRRLNVPYYGDVPSLAPGDGP